jgi:hypothetical protein
MFWAAITDRCAIAEGEEDDSGIEVVELLLDELWNRH